MKKYPNIAVIGAILFLHSFLYETLFVEWKILPFLDWVGAISSLPYGTYYIGVGVLYVGTGIIGRYQQNRHGIPLRNYAMWMIISTVVAYIAMIAFIRFSIQSPRATIYLLALTPLQVGLAPLYSLDIKNQDPIQFYAMSLRRWYWLLSLALFVPALLIVANVATEGGWRILALLWVGIIAVFNVTFTAGLLWCARGFSVKRSTAD